MIKIIGGLLVKADRKERQIYQEYLAIKTTYGIRQTNQRSI